MSDALKLKEIYSPEISIADDLMAHLVNIAHGSVRRVCVNLVNVQEYAMLHGLDAIDRADLGYSAAVYRRCSETGLIMTVKQRSSWKWWG
jgi:hypothetical protein